MRLRKLDPRSLGSAQLAAIGPATEKALEEQGFVCDLVPDMFLSEGFVHALNKEGEEATIPSYSG